MASDLTNNPLVSVIITVFNREKFVRDAIESVLASSFQDFELLIVDDLSTDNSVDIIKEYSTHPQVRIYQNERNLGQFGNRNYAASLATGKYIKFLDSDDIIYPHGLQVMVETIEGFPGAGAAISHDKLHEEKPYPLYMKPKEAWMAFYLRKGFPNSGPSASIINTMIFRKVGGYPEPFYVGTDILLWLEISAISGIIKMPPSLNWYRIHESQELSKGLASNEYLKNNHNFYKSYLNRMESPLTEEEKSLALKSIKYRHIRSILNLAFKQHKILLAFKIFKESDMKIKDLLRAI